ncbi:cupin domain-containing protein [Sporosarcina aquimarina]|uniref:cupin domain-containing protein n=1 Tax=Sporosarcina aquimarina TaxID=114975 RepID=UPI00203E910C|nr:cupin domain-containing protein [Sporosarcina aquimarina]MCM3757113.1 cupin domain-containing protein [Sporosarcina aquimarina]
MKHSATYWTKKLKLETHPEGGSFAGSYAAESTIETSTGTRPLYTSIYFMLADGEISHFHQLQSDELWYYHDGNALSVHMISTDGEYSSVKLGLDIDKGELPQILVPAGTIFGSSMIESGDYALVGCMVSPGFDFEDFKLFSEEELVEQFPQHTAIIKKMTP